MITAITQILQALHTSVLEIPTQYFRDYSYNPNLASIAHIDSTNHHGCACSQVGTCSEMALDVANKQTKCRRLFSTHNAYKTKSG